MGRHLSTRDLLEKGLYIRDRSRLVSRFYPGFNIVPRPVPTVATVELERSSPPHRLLRIDQRPLRLATGEPADLRLEDEPHFGRIIEGHDVEETYRGLQTHLLLPDRRIWIVDEHHLLYFLLWEARFLGLLPRPAVLVNFDAHHDAASLHADPPSTLDLTAQADYLMREVRIGNHVTALVRSGLVRRVHWVTHREELEYRSSDIDRELAAAPDVFAASVLETLPDGALSPGSEPTVVSLDWDLLTALYNGGRMLQPVKDVQVEDFLRQWHRLGLRVDAAACTVVATSPGYANDESTLAGVRRLLPRLP